MLDILLERGMFYEQLMYDIIIDGTIFVWKNHVQSGKGSMNFFVKWEGGQKVGHETQMIYYLILTTDIQVLIIYLMI